MVVKSGNSKVNIKLGSDVLRLINRYHERESQNFELNLIQVDKTLSFHM